MPRITKQQLKAIADSYDQSKGTIRKHLEGLDSYPRLKDHSDHGAIRALKEFATLEGNLLDNLAMHLVHAFVIDHPVKASHASYQAWLMTLTHLCSKTSNANAHFYAEALEILHAANQLTDVVITSLLDAPVTVAQAIIEQSNPETLLLVMEHFQVLCKHNNPQFYAKNLKIFIEICARLPEDSFNDNKDLIINHPNPQLLLMIIERHAGTLNQNHPNVTQLCTAVIRFSQGNPLLTTPRSTLTSTQAITSSLRPVEPLSFDKGLHQQRQSGTTPAISPNQV